MSTGEFSKDMGKITKGTDEITKDIGKNSEQYVKYYTYR